MTVRIGRRSHWGRSRRRGRLWRSGRFPVKMLVEYCWLGRWEAYGCTCGELELPCGDIGWERECGRSDGKDGEEGGGEFHDGE